MKPKRYHSNISRCIPDADHHAFSRLAAKDQSFDGLRNYALYLLLYTSGPRISEALSLSIGQLFDGFQVRDRFYLPAKSTKGKLDGKICPLYDKHNILRRALVKYHEKRLHLCGRTEPSDFFFIGSPPVHGGTKGRPPLAVRGGIKGGPPLAVHAGIKGGPPLPPSSGLQTLPESSSFMGARMQGGPLHRSVFNKWFTRLQKSCGILLPYRVHDLRHTAAQRFYEGSGHDLKLTQAFTGHRRPETLMKYLHTDPTGDDRCRVAAKI